jgi:hypothetical protein
MRCANKCPQFLRGILGDFTIGERKKAFVYFFFFHVFQACLIN